VPGISVRNFERKISEQELEMGIRPKTWNIQVLILKLKYKINLNLFINLLLL
jgi:hypothetical protein